MWHINRWIRHVVKGGFVYFYGGFIYVTWRIRLKWWIRLYRKWIRHMSIWIRHLNTWIRHAMKGELIFCVPDSDFGMTDSYMSQVGFVYNDESASVINESVRATNESGRFSNESGTFIYESVPKFVPHALFLCRIHKKWTRIHLWMKTDSLKFMSALWS